MSFNRRTLSKESLKDNLNDSFTSFNSYLIKSNSYSYADKFSQMFHDYYTSLELTTREELFNYLKKCK